MAVLWEPRLAEDALAWQRKAKELTDRYFRPLAAELDRDQRYPLEHLPVLRESGLSSMFVPTQYGGRGASVTAMVAVVEEVSKGCASTSAILAALSLGAFPVLLGGTEEQKSRLLGGLAEKGEAVCFALSERNAGSDVGGITTTAVRENGGWRIRGEKCWLGNGGHSLHYVVFARTDPDPAKKAVSAFIVPRHTDGVVVDYYEDKMGIRGTTTTNLKLDVWVDDKSMVGEPGKGLRLALATLNIGRVVIAAQANGIALAAYEDACQFAVARHAFGQAIIDHQAIGFKLADMATRLSASRLLMYEAARAYDAGENISSIGAMAKLFASEASHMVVDEGMQILGGRGYVKTSPMERYYRDQRITEIYEGTSEIQRLVLARAIKNQAAEQG
jgi:alkylation response protein AidB-like acyl-CoA dehydrogenase